MNEPEPGDPKREPFNPIGGIIFGVLALGVAGGLTVAAVEQGDSPTFAAFIEPVVLGLTILGAIVIAGAVLLAFWTQDR